MNGDEKIGPLHAMPFMEPYIDFLERIAESYISKVEPMVILEVGVAYGYSTRAFLRGLKKRKTQGKLYSIDIDSFESLGWKPSPEIIGDWEFIEGDSRKVKWNKVIDILLIDGGHSYDCVKADYRKFEPFVVSGGLIFMHDVTNQGYGVKDFWKEICYNKIILPFNHTGFGIVNKIKQIK